MLFCCSNEKTKTYLQSNEAPVNCGCYLCFTCIGAMESDCRIPMSCLRPRILALHALFWGLVSLRWEITDDLQHVDLSFALLCTWKEALSMDCCLFVYNFFLECLEQLFLVMRRPQVNRDTFCIQKWFVLCCVGFNESFLPFQKQNLIMITSWITLKDISMQYIYNTHNVTEKQTSLGCNKTCRLQLGFFTLLMIRCILSSSSTVNWNSFWLFISLWFMEHFKKELKLGGALCRWLRWTGLMILCRELV